MSYLTSWLTQERQKQLKGYWPIFVSSISLLFIIISLSLLCLRSPDISNNKQLKLSTHQLQLDQKQTLEQLARIENHLTQLNAHTDKANVSSEETQLVKQQLAAIQHSIEILQGDTHEGNIQKAIAKENQVIYQRLDKMQNLLARLKQHSQPVNSSHTIPFRIISIDIWNGQPMAIIQLGRELALMAEGDSRAGWVLIQINFETAEITFKDSNLQYRRVKV